MMSQQFTTCFCLSQIIYKSLKLPFKLFICLRIYFVELSTAIKFSIEMISPLNWLKQSIHKRDKSSSIYGNETNNKPPVRLTDNIYQRKGRSAYFNASSKTDAEPKKKKKSFVWLTSHHETHTDSSSIWKYWCNLTSQHSWSENDNTMEIWLVKGYYIFTLCFASLAFAKHFWYLSWHDSSRFIICASSWLRATNVAEALPVSAAWLIRAIADNTKLNKVQQAISRYRSQKIINKNGIQVDR